MVVEVELRSFIDEATYNRLLDFFSEKGKDLGEEYQETSYFKGDLDLRIQKSSTYSKVWLKKGKLHDDHREEIEIKTKVEDFNELEKLFTTLGYEVEIKWFRTRRTFEYRDVTVMIDYSKGYGHIFEVEKLVEEGQEVKALEDIRKIFEEVGVEEVSKEEQKKKYLYYKENWKELTK